MTEVVVFEVGDRVRKSSGEYRFEGVVVAAFYKRNGASVRYCVESDDGVLFVVSSRRLDLVSRRSAPDVSVFPPRPRLRAVVDQPSPPL